MTAPVRETLRLKPPPAPLPAPAPEPRAKPALAPSVPFTQPHWIVLRLPPSHQPNKFAYRHGSAEAAAKEAARLSRRYPGVSFVVYGSAGVFCVEEGA